MSSENCFLEAHFYSGGLRHQFYSNSKSRPSWAPSADSVGFSDEFDLADGDAAVEIRRFAVGQDKVTWIGVYYRSIDARMGDRGNHAGVGAWFQNQVATDSHAILHGLSLLAMRISQDIDPSSIEVDALKFLSPTFLPAYLLDQNEIAPSIGFPFEPAGIVDSKLYLILCEATVSECRALADFVANALILEKKALAARLLIKVGKMAREDRNRLEAIPVDYEVTSKLLHAMPQLVGTERARAATAEAEAAAAQKRLCALEADYSGLKAETADLARFRDDPQRIVNQRLADLHAEMRDLSAKIDNLSFRPTAAPTWTPAARRKPVGNVPTEEHVENNGDIWWWVAVTVGFLAVVALIVIAIDRLLPIG